MSGVVRGFLVGLSVVVLAVGLLACSTTGTIKDVMLPLAVVRKVVMDNIPGGVKKESPNGREITSEYFNPKNLDEEGEELRDRAKSVVTILGSRRPYNITVTTTVEQRIKGSKKYDKLGEDSKLNKAVTKRIKEALANRPADLNVIDDFRAF